MVHAGSSSLQQKINDYEYRHTLNEKQLKKVQNDMNERKIAEAELVSRIDMISTKIEGEKK